MSGTGAEKQVRADLSAKNQLRREIERRLSRIRRWGGGLAGAGSHRGVKRYRQAIQRARAELEQLKAQLAKENATLRAALPADGYSAEKLAAFLAEFGKARAEAVEARKTRETRRAKKLEKKGLAPAGDDVAALAVPFSELVARVRRRVHGAEADSPAPGRRFQAEVERIGAEQLHFGLPA